MYNNCQGKACDLMYFLVSVHLSLFVIIVFLSELFTGSVDVNPSPFSLKLDFVCNFSEASKTI